MRAAERGDAVELKALLAHPGCNPLSEGSNKSVGMTALMHAAGGGNMDCVHLLLPLSHALEEDEGALTASGYARSLNQEGAAALIDAYMRSMSERSAIKDTTHLVASQKSALRRL